MEVPCNTNPEDEVSFIEFLFLRGHHCSEEKSIARDKAILRGQSFVFDGGLTLCCLIVGSFVHLPDLWLDL